MNFCPFAVEAIVCLISISNLGNNKRRGQNYAYICLKKVQLDSEKPTSVLMRPGIGLLMLHVYKMLEYKYTLHL